MEDGQIDGFDWTQEFFGRERAQSRAFSVFSVPEESFVNLLMSDNSFGEEGADETPWEVGVSETKAADGKKGSLRSKVMAMRGVLKMLKALKGKKKPIGEDPPPNGQAGSAAGDVPADSANVEKGSAPVVAGVGGVGEKVVPNEELVWDLEVPPQLGMKNFSQMPGLSFLDGLPIGNEEPKPEGVDGVQRTDSEASITMEGDIDEVLMRLEDAPVLSRAPSASNDMSDFNAFHAIPDLAKIFRAPSYVMNHMAIGISPSRWAKLAPDNAAPARRWSLLRSVVNTGIAFRMGAKKAVASSAEEAARKKEQLQLEVDRFKSKLLHITDEWEDFRVREETALDEPLPPPLAPGSSASASASASAYPDYHFQHQPPPHAFPTPQLQAPLHDLPPAGVPASVQPPMQQAAVGPPAGGAPYTLMPHGPFVVKSVASGSCYLFPGLSLEGKVLDIDVLVQKCQGQFPTFPGFQISEVLLGRGEGGAQPKKRARQQNLRCSFKVMPDGSSEAITIKVWSDGKTLSHGCKHRRQLLDVNRFIKQVIQHSEMVQGPPVLCGRLREFGADIFAGLEVPDQDDGGRLVEVLSAPLLGSWDLNLKAQRLKLHLDNLAQHLREPSFSDRISEVRFVPPTGNAVRFHNMSIYVRRECLSRWPAHNAEMASIYVNVYESGKCTVLAAPSEEVANELADLVSSILHSALEQPNIRVEI